MRIFYLVEDDSNMNYIVLNNDNMSEEDVIDDFFELTGIECEVDKVEDVEDQLFDKTEFINETCAIELNRF